MAGGIDWFRWHHGSVTDPKFQLVARKSGASLPDVLAVWAYLLESASANEFRGRFSGIDCEAVDCLFGFNDGTTQSIISRMVERELITDECHVVAWEKRQPKREREEDKSTARVQAFRQKQRSETPRNTTEHQETPRGEESREEKKEDKTKEKPARKRADALPCPEDVNCAVWADWLALRKAKRAPVSATVVEEARQESGKAGMSLTAFLRVWCARGSQGLQAEWLKPAERATGPPSEPAWRTEQRARNEAFLGPAAASRRQQPQRFEVIYADAKALD